jgi:hypothetical protein
MRRLFMRLDHAGAAFAGDRLPLAAGHYAALMLILGPVLLLAFYRLVSPGSRRSSGWPLLFGAGALYGGASLMSTWASLAHGHDVFRHFRYLVGGLCLIPLGVLLIVAGIWGREP